VLFDPLEKRSATSLRGRRPPSHRSGVPADHEGIADEPAPRSVPLPPGDLDRVHRHCLRPRHRPLGISAMSPARTICLMA